MKFIQKKAKNNIEFNILPNHLEYALKDAGSKGEYTIDYDMISPNKSEITEKNEGYKNYAIYLLVLSFIFFAAVIFFEMHTNALIFLLGSAIMYSLYIRSKVTFTVLAGDYRIYIIQDKQHDKILNEIYKARKEYMRSKYVFINPKNDKEEEINKFRWLLRQKVITEDEFERTKLELAPKVKSKSSKRIIN